jgi:hypothetical protein
MVALTFIILNCLPQAFRAGISVGHCKYIPIRSTMASLPSTSAAASAPSYHSLRFDLSGLIGQSKVKSFLDQSILAFE